MSKGTQRTIEVWADWIGLGGPTFMGTLLATRSRGKHRCASRRAPRRACLGGVFIVVQVGVIGCGRA